MTDTIGDRRPEWLRRKHGQQRSEPYLDLLTAAARCPARPGHDQHERTVIIRSVFDLDGNELPIGTEDEARNVSNALYRSRPRDSKGQFLVSLPKPELIQAADGTWEVRCCVHDKTSGDAHIRADPSRKTYDPDARRAEAATRGTARRRPSRAATEREQVALRRPIRQAVQDVIEGKPADPASIPAGIPAAPAGYCQDCGKRIKNPAAGQLRCVGCETGLEVIRLKTAEAKAQERRRKDAEIAARLQARRQAVAQVTPATRLRDWWKSVS